ncbi:MAG: endonuclease VIII [Dysgonamonadaceae bacterium]|jgi:formamidopyrimidine-DNA glycosylase|nr:endonuclease VIII [Dysgonamonadaceae bacterium]
MLEIPESKTIATQAQEVLIGKMITRVVNATSPHKFAWFNGDPLKYGDLLVGRQIESANGHGMFVDLHLNADTHITIGDGTNLRYYIPLEKQPAKHQLLLEFDDKSFLVFTIAMYGAIYAYKGAFDNEYYTGSLNSTSPLSEKFDEVFFENLFRSAKKDLSAKALLATEQRIPGLGNGTLQDILFNSGINPRRKMSTISDLEKGDLFHNLKFNLRSMTDKGGRDTEKDLFGNFGGYKTILSKNTYKNPCPNCGNAIVKEAYMGGSVYYCPICQKL